MTEEKSMDRRTDALERPDFLTPEQEEAERLEQQNPLLGSPFVSSKAPEHGSTLDPRWERRRGWSTSRLYHWTASFFIMINAVWMLLLPWKTASGNLLSLCASLLCVILGLGDGRVFLFKQQARWFLESFWIVFYGIAVWQCARSFAENPMEGLVLWGGVIGGPVAALLLFVTSGWARKRDAVSVFFISGEGQNSVLIVLCGISILELAFKSYIAAVSSILLCVYFLVTLLHLLWFTQKSQRGLPIEAQR